MGLAQDISGLNEQKGFESKQGRANSCIVELPMCCWFLCVVGPCSCWDLKSVLLLSHCWIRMCTLHSWHSSVSSTLTQRSNASHRDAHEVTSLMQHGLWVHFYVACSRTDVNPIYWVNCWFTPDKCWQAAVHHTRNALRLVLQQCWPQSQHSVCCRAWHL